MMKRGMLLSLIGLAASACVGSGEIAAHTGISCSARLAAPSEVRAVMFRAADGRAIPGEIFYPANPGRYPLVGFSHGAFSAPDRYHAMLLPLAAAGYIIIAPMHRDSEEARVGKVSQEEVWQTRVEDLALALSAPAEARQVLIDQGISVDDSRIFAMGHSFGALIAQLAGGAVARSPDGKLADSSISGLDGVIAWSPPGAMPNVVAPADWAGVSVPSMALTGTSDVLAGFVDDWTWHKQSFTSMPGGSKSLWIGEGVDHYFGGSFGREKPADENSRQMFARALAQVVAFLDRAADRREPCDAGPEIVGESLEHG